VRSQAKFSPSEDEEHTACTTQNRSYIKLLGGLEYLDACFIFPSIGNVIIPTEEVHHFSDGQAQPPSRTIFNHQSW
jgi:hypothetical protein